MFDHDAESERAQRPNRRPDRWPELPPLITGQPPNSQKLAETLPQFAEELFFYAVALLGDDDARELFRAVANKKFKRPHGARGKGKNLDLGRDRILLNAYDVARRKPDYVSIPIVARQLFDNDPRDLGGTAKAIEQHLRRLLKRRQRGTVLRSLAGPPGNDKR